MTKHSYFSSYITGGVFMNTEKVIKIAKYAVPATLCVTFFVHPFFQLLGLLMGLDYVPNAEIFAVFCQMVLAVGGAVFMFLFRPLNKVGRICMSLCLPLSLLNVLCFMGGEWGGSVFVALLSSGAVFAVYLKLVPDSVFKAACVVVSVLLTIVIAVVYVWGLIAGAISDTTVESTVCSVNESYFAEIRVKDSLFGAKTEIVIKRSESDIGVLFGSYSAHEMLVYEGEPHEAKTALVNWLDDETLIINGTAYRVYVE